jgi:hypothetical protein
MTAEERISQLADLVCALAKRVKELEKKVAALEKSSPLHLGKIERRGS